MVRSVSLPHDSPYVVRHTVLVHSWTAVEQEHTSPPSLSSDPPHFLPNCRDTSVMHSLHSDHHSMSAPALLLLPQRGSYRHTAPVFLRKTSSDLQRLPLRSFEPSDVLGNNGVNLASDFQQKQVHFGTRRTTVIPAVPDSETSHLWWDDHALDKRRRTDKVICSRNSVNKNPSYHIAMMRLMESFDKADRQKLTDQVRTIRKANLRGLEHRIVHTLRGNRVRAVQGILKAQLQTSNPEKLRQTSLRLSRTSRQIAFRLAQADRLEAKDVYEEGN